MAADVASAAAPDRGARQDDPAAGPLGADRRSRSRSLGVLIIIPLVNVFYEAFARRPRRLLGQPLRRPGHAERRSC